MKRLAHVVIVLLLVTLPGFARAGSSAAGKPVLPAAEVAEFSDRVQLDLAARGAHVAIVARIGRDPSQLPAGVTYTHVGFWVYSRITQENGSIAKGYRVYK